MQNDQRAPRCSSSSAEPDGKKGPAIFASVCGNDVWPRVEPVTACLGASTMHELVDDLSARLSFTTLLKTAAFYWLPYSYIGDNVDPLVQPQRADLVPGHRSDVLLGAHARAAPVAFSPARHFRSYRGGGFSVAEHGSWNRASRAGYQWSSVDSRIESPQPIRCRS